MRAMIAGIGFITGNSALDYAGQPLPEVTVVGARELQLLIQASQASHPLSQGAQSRGRVAAFYDRHARRIVLADEASVTGPALLHELVHYLQDVNGKDDMFASRPVCLEAEAFDLQAFWQTEYGIDLASKPDYGFVATLYGVCNDADFSFAGD